MTNSETRAHLLVVILHQTAQLPKLLEAWHTIDLPGVTVLRSAGGHRTRTWLQEVGLGALGDLFTSDDIESKTLLSVIEDEKQLEQAIVEAEGVIGNFYEPGTGLLFVMPVTRAIGIYKTRPRDQDLTELQPSVQEAMTESERLTRDTTVAEVNDILDLDPIIVPANQPLIDLAEMMLDHPGVTVACVVNPDLRLIGLLTLNNLADDLLMLVFPEDFLSETKDLETALRYARFSGAHTAEDAMDPPVWVREEESLKSAFHKMHDNELSGIPIVNDRHEVTGYINLVELLALYARSQPPKE
jgi:CBS domain-containing protein